MKSLRKRETLLREQIDLAEENIFPNGDPQERQLNIFYFLSLYGRELLERVKDGLPEEGGEHYFVHIA